MSNPLLVRDGKTGKAAVNLEVSLDSYVSIYLARRHLLLFHFLPNLQDGTVFYQYFPFCPLSTRVFHVQPETFLRKSFEVFQCSFAIKISAIFTIQGKDYNKEIPTLKGQQSMKPNGIHYLLCRYTILLCKEALCIWDLVDKALQVHITGWYRSYTVQSMALHCLCEAAKIPLCQQEPGVKKGDVALCLGYMKCILFGTLASPYIQPSFLSY